MNAEKEIRKSSNTQRKWEKCQLPSPSYFFILFLLTLSALWVDNCFFSKMKTLIENRVPATLSVLLTANTQKQEKKALNFIGLLLHLVRETAQMPTANNALPCLPKVKSRAPWEPKLVLRFSQYQPSKHGSSFTAPHLCVQPPQTLFWSLPILFWSTLPLLSSSFSFPASPCSVSGWNWQWNCWTTDPSCFDPSRSNCIADSILRACSHQISLQHSRFQYPKNSDAYLNQTSWGWTIPSAKTARAGPTHTWTRFHQSTGDSMPTTLKAISTYITSTQSDLVNYWVNCLGIHIYIQKRIHRSEVKSLSCSIKNFVLGKWTSENFLYNVKWNHLYINFGTYFDVRFIDIIM